MAPVSKAALLKAAAYSSPRLSHRQHPRLASLTLDSGLQISPLSPAQHEEAGGCMDEDNCVRRTLQLARVYGPAVAPPPRHFIGNKHPFREQVDRALAL